MPDNVIDQPTFQALKEMSGPDFMPELIDTFLEDAPNMLQELQRALDAGDTEAFRRTAHSLKSNCKTFGALALAERARELEYLGREDRLGDVGGKLEQLAIEYDQVASALKSLRDG
jgi:HPt (histidine-containing phosphotransfer) domain-containing protein